MPNLTFSNFSYKNQYEVGSGTNVVTAIRERFTTVPQYSKTTNRAGVGGNDTRSSLGWAYHNSTFIRLARCEDSEKTYTKFSDLPTTLSIKKATLQWGIFRADDGNQKATTWYIRPCKSSISNKLTGQNQPNIDSSTEIIVPRSSGYDRGTPLSIDITNLVKTMVRKGYDCFKIWTPRGRNRRYLLDPTADIPKVVIEYNAAPTKVTGTVTTDCIGDSIVEKTLKIKIGETDAKYFRYRLSTGYKSAWTQEKTHIINTSNISDGASIGITVEASYVPAPDSKCIKSVNLITIKKNQNVSISMLLKGIGENNLYTVTPDSLYVGTEGIQIRGSIPSFYGIRKGKQALLQILVLGVIKAQEVEKTSIAKDITLVPGKEDVGLSVAIRVLTGFSNRTVTKSAQLISAKTPTVTLNDGYTRLIPNGKNWMVHSRISESNLLPHNRVNTKFNTTLEYQMSNGEVSNRTYDSQTSNVENPTHTMELPQFNAVKEDNDSLKILDSAGNTLNINSLIEVTGVINVTNVIGQKCSSTIYRNVNTSPTYENVDNSYGEISRTHLDIFGVKTYTDDIRLGYSALVIPELEENVPPNMNIHMNTIYDAPTDRDILKNVVTVSKNNTNIHSFTFVGNEWVGSNETFSTNSNLSVRVDASDSYNIWNKNFIRPVYIAGFPNQPGSYIFESYTRRTNGPVDFTYNGLEYTTYNETIVDGIHNCGNYIRLLIPVGDESTVPGTSINHRRVKVKVSQGNITKYHVQSSIGDIVQYNGSDYYELFFPVDLEPMIGKYVKFEVAYIDRFDRESPYYWNLIEYNPFKEPKIDLCGTFGGGVRWLFQNPSVTEITDRGYLYNQLFYAKIRNYNTNTYKSRMEIGILDDSSNFVLLGQEPQRDIQGAEVPGGFADSITDARYFNDGNPIEVFQYTLDTTYYIKVSIYDDAGIIVAQTPFTKDYTFKVVTEYRREKEDKGWTANDFLKGTLIQADQIAILNDYIRRQYTMYKVGCEPLCIDPRKFDIIYGKLAESDHTSLIRLHTDMNVDTWRYHPVDMLPGHNRWGTEFQESQSTASGNIFKGVSKYIPISPSLAMTENGAYWLEIVPKVKIKNVNAYGHQITITVNLFDIGLSPIGTSYTFMEQIPTPAVDNAGAPIAVDDILEYGVLLQDDNIQELLKTCAYIQVTVEVESSAREYFSIIEEDNYASQVDSYVIPNTFTQAPIGYSMDIYQTANGEISKTDVINILKQSILLLIDYISKDSDTILTPREVIDISYNRDELILSQKGSESAQLGDLDIIALDNEEKGGIFNLFKSW